MQYKFVKLQPHASSVVRAITAPYQYYSHFVNGKYVPCTQKIAGGCRECGNDKPKPRWFLGVIDRSNGQYSILNMNIGLFKKLQEVVRNPKYGDPKSYDIEIKMNEVQLMKASLADMYDVIPKEKFSEVVDEEKRDELNLKLIKLTDPLCMELDKISSSDSFKNFYLSIRLDQFMVSTMTKVVPKWYPQYQETLQKLITFS